MVSNHARKNAAVRRRADSGENHRQAADAVRMVAFAQFPPPDLNGARPCAACRGTGVSDEMYQQPVDAGTPLLVAVVCRTCGGCGRDEHTLCPPGAHAGEDVEYDGFEDDFDYDDERDVDEQDPCPSCRGRRFNYLAGFRQDPQAEQAGALLRERAYARGVSEWDLMGATATGQLDDLLGDGAQQLAAAADTTVYLKVPCGCAEELIRTLPVSELTDDDERGQR